MESSRKPKLYTHDRKTIWLENELKEKRNQTSPFTYKPKSFHRIKCHLKQKDSRVTQPTEMSVIATKVPDKFYDLPPFVSYKNSRLLECRMWVRQGFDTSKWEVSLIWRGLYYKKRWKRTAYQVQGSTRSLYQSFLRNVQLNSGDSRNVIDSPFHLNSWNGSARSQPQTSTTSSNRD